MSNNPDIYAGPRFFSDGVAWKAIREADRPVKTTKTKPGIPTYNGYPREEVETMYAKYRNGQIRKAFIENLIGMPLNKIARDFLRRRF